jgi:hypothetical protein
METLSRLMIPVHCDGGQSSLPVDLAPLQHDLRYVATLSAPDLADFLALAHAHHVFVRALTLLRRAAILDNDKGMANWCGSCLMTECSRIDRAVASLHQICEALESRGCNVAVIKSFTHWPDLGSDLDLYTTGDTPSVAHVMRERFGAWPIGRSWGDRLANKWNYKVPGLDELVEIHVRFLGQTGEFAEMGRRIILRRIPKNVSGYDFSVPAAEESIILAALQRMYRHFYFRLCDFVDISSLLQSKAVDFAELMAAANAAGIWDGVATFLCVVQHYIQSYGGVLPLPNAVMASARSCRSGIRFKNGFLRVSKTTAAALYGSQVLQAGLRHDVRALLRLPLLPPLAITALLAHRLTGNDKRIW